MSRFRPGTLSQAASSMLAAALVLFLSACATAPLPRAFPEGERIFHADPRWLGGDAAISVPLGGERILWLFGDSFVDPSAPYARSGAAFPRNTIAIQTGLDPRKATMHFAWGRDAHGAPVSFFPDDGNDWFWPGDGIRLADGTLAIFLHRMRATGEDGPLGFASRGYALALIANPDAPPEEWSMRIIQGPSHPAKIIPGAALLAFDTHVITLAVREGDHAGTFVSWPMAALARGDLSAGLWWAGAARGWLPAPDLGVEGPAMVLAQAGVEASLHWDGCAFVHVSSQGFGASDVARRTAPEVTGPWSAPEILFRPPESDAERPFVYAGKAHPDLDVPGRHALAITWVANSFTPDDLKTPEGGRALYWPRLALAVARACVD